MARTVDDFDTLNRQIRNATDKACCGAQNFCQVIEGSNGLIKKALTGDKNATPTPALRKSN